MNSIKISSFLAVILILIVAGKASAQPKAVAERTSYDFGNVVQDSVVKKTFTIINEGSDTLTINNIKVSCGCTAAVAGKKELGPLESTEIKVSFDSKGKIGRQNKIITVFTNDPNNGIIKISITGNILKNN